MSAGSGPLAARPAGRRGRARPPAAATAPRSPQQEVGDLEHHVHRGGVSPAGERGRQVDEPYPELSATAAGPGGSRQLKQQRVVGRPVVRRHLAHQVTAEQVPPQRRPAAGSAAISSLMSILQSGRTSPSSHPGVVERVPADAVGRRPGGSAAARSRPFLAGSSRTRSHHLVAGRRTPAGRPHGVVDLGQVLGDPRLAGPGAASAKGRRARADRALAAPEPEKRDRRRPPVPVLPVQRCL